MSLKENRMKKILTEDITNFPLEWANLESYRNSGSFRREVYLKDESNIANLASLFYLLFGSRKEEILIYDKSWWDFCLDTWDIQDGLTNYDLKGKTKETQDYLSMLLNSGINKKFQGCCKCTDWDRFLHIVLSCILNHIAPYSQLFCDIKNEYFFYFHETGSIGLYFKHKNVLISEILEKAELNYRVVE